MDKTPLAGGWQADLGDGFVEAQVPGCWDTPSGSKLITGPVTYRRELACPAVPKGQRLLLSFDAVSYACDVLVNGRAVGSHEGLWDRFLVDITDAAKAGVPNEIRLVVEKPGYRPTDRFPLRDVLSGFIPDVLCTFGGIWGDVDLLVTAPVFPDHVSLRTTRETHEAQVTAGIMNISDAPMPAEITLRVSSRGRVAASVTRSTVQQPGLATIVESIPLDGLARWSPDAPALHDLEIVVATPAGVTRMQKAIGLREIRADGDRILLNGEPVYLRGALHWGSYPDRIAPRPTRSEIRRELEELRGMGFNAIKHCLWVPRDEYYELCDQLGFLAWLEMPLWLPRATPALESRMEREYPRILRQVAHHPSIIACSLGCELGKEVPAALLEGLARQARELSGGALVRDNSGSGECYGGLAVDFSDFYDYHFYADAQNLEPLMEAFTPRWRALRPWLYGEYADADTWREIGPAAPWWARKDDQGNPVSALKPDFRLHLQDERLARPGIRGRSAAVAAASLEHALLHRKLSIESTRAFAQVCGYNVTAIRDVPIATSGLFDDNGTAKFAPAALRQFNADLVLVPRWDLARVWINGDRTFEADRYNQRAGGELALRIVASNYGPALPRAAWSWSIARADGAAVARGAGVLDAPLGRGQIREIFRISERMPGTGAPLRLAVTAVLEQGSVRVENTWPLFVWPRPAGAAAGRVAFLDPLGILEPVRELYHAEDPGPGSAPGPGTIVAATTFDARLERHLQHGGKALLVQRGRGAFPHARVAFWREGITLFEDHPIAGGIPTGSFRELALYGIATDTALSWIEPGGPVGAVTPIVTRIDAREFLAHHYMVELAWGRGRLIVTTLRLEGGMGKQPAGMSASSAAGWLFGRALEYLGA